MASHFDSFDSVASDLNNLDADLACLSNNDINYLPIFEPLLPLPIEPLSYQTAHAYEAMQPSQPESASSDQAAVGSPIGEMGHVSMWDGWPDVQETVASTLIGSWSSVSDASAGASLPRDNHSGLHDAASAVAHLPDGESSMPQDQLLQDASPHPPPPPVSPLAHGHDWMDSIPAVQLTHRSLGFEGDALGCGNLRVGPPAEVMGVRGPPHSAPLPVEELPPQPHAQPATRPDLSSRLAAVLNDLSTAKQQRVLSDLQAGTTSLSASSKQRQPLMGLGGSTARNDRNPHNSSIFLQLQSVQCSHGRADEHCYHHHACNCGSDSGGHCHGSTDQCSHGNHSQHCGACDIGSGGHCHGSSVHVSRSKSTCESCSGDLTPIHSPACNVHSCATAVLQHSVTGHVGRRSFGYTALCRCHSDSPDDPRAGYHSNASEALLGVQQLKRRQVPTLLPENERAVRIHTDVASSCSGGGGGGASSCKEEVVCDHQQHHLHAATSAPHLLLPCSSSHRQQPLSRSDGRHEPNTAPSYGPRHVSNHSRLGNQPASQAAWQSGDLFRQPSMSAAGGEVASRGEVVGEEDEEEEEEEQGAGGTLVAVGRGTAIRVLLADKGGNPSLGGKAGAPFRRFSSSNMPPLTEWGPGITAGASGLAGPLPPPSPFLPINLTSFVPGNGGAGMSSSVAASAVQSSMTARDRVLHKRLTALAEAMATGEKPRFRYFRRQLSKVASPHGDVMQRFLFHMLAAVDARMDGSAMTKWREPLSINFESIMEVMGPNQPVCKPSYYDFCLTAIVCEVKRAVFDACDRKVVHTCQARGELAAGQQYRQKQEQEQVYESGDRAAHVAYTQWVKSGYSGATPAAAAAASASAGGYHYCNDPFLSADERSGNDCTCSCPRRQSFHIIAFGLWLSHHWYDILHSIASHFKQRQQQSGGRCCCSRWRREEGSDNGSGIGSGQSSISGDDVSSGGPCMPLIRVTAVDFNVVSVSEVTEPMIVMAGRYLELLAASFGLPFEFYGVHTTPQDFHPSLIRSFPHSHVIAIDIWSIMLFPDKSALRSDPRSALLNWLSGIHPILVLLLEVDANGNGPFFLPRFQEAARSALGFFESVGAVLPQDSAVRLMFETMLGRDIMNCLGCEGVERWVRCDKLALWLDRMDKCNLKPRPFHPATVETLRDCTEGMDGRYCIDHGSDRVCMSSGESSHVLRLMWQGSPMVAATSWHNA